MGTDHQRLFDVSGFRGAGDEAREGVLTDRHSSVRFVHIVDHLRRGNHDRDVLRNEVQDSMPDIVVGDPDRGVLRHSIMALQNGEVHVFQIVWISDRVEIDGVVSNAGNNGTADFSVAPLRLRSQMRVGFGKTADTYRQTADQLQDLSKLCRWISKRLPCRHRRKIGER